MSASGEHRWPVGLPTRIRPVRVIGQGATGVVWQGRNTRDGVDVAVKVLLPRVDGTDPGVRLEQEARALARLRGVEGVISVHDVGRCRDGASWLVCDLAPGGSLAARAPLSGADLLVIGISLAATLERIHLLDVVHGDITPANVLFGADGSPLLADFAMAALDRHGDPPGGLTPAFAAPERIGGAEPTPAADVYSLAATLRRSGRTAEVDGLDPVLARCMASAAGERPAAPAMQVELDAIRR